jgi:hypothetical protein
VTASRPNGRSGASRAAWLSVPVRDAQSERSESCDERAREKEVRDAYAVEPDAPPPGCERVYAVVGDGDQSNPKAELAGQLACTGPEADHLGPLPRRVVAQALAEGAGGAACEGWVSACLDLQLERRAGAVVRSSARVSAAADESGP